MQDRRSFLASERRAPSFALFTSRVGTVDPFNQLHTTCFLLTAHLHKPQHRSSTAQDGSPLYLLPVFLSLVRIFSSRHSSASLRMWYLFSGRSPPPKSNATTAVNAVALSTSRAVASPTILRHTAELPALNVPPQKSLATSNNVSAADGSRPISTAPSSVSAPSPSRESSASGAPHVVVFLDGDGDCFINGILDQRYDGGRLAAIEVHDRAGDWLQRKVGPGGEVEVSVMLFW